MAKTAIPVASGALGARDDELDRLAKLWSHLPELDPRTFVDHAEHLIRERVGVVSETSPVN